LVDPEMVLECIVRDIVKFERDKLAKWYATQHLKTDPGVVSVHYLPKNAGEREIRFIEVNKLIADRFTEVLEPIDFGVDMGKKTEHRLLVLDVTPKQWVKIQNQELSIPNSWSLEQEQVFPPSRIRSVK